MHYKADMFAIKSDLKETFRLRRDLGDAAIDYVNGARRPARRMKTQLRAGVNVYKSILRCASCGHPVRRDNILFKILHGGVEPPSTFL